MNIEGAGRQLRIIVGEDVRWQGTPLYEAIILKAREMGLAGATAWRGMMGYGADSRIHTAKVLRLSEDLPVVIEIVDRPDRIDAFLPVLDGMVGKGLVTVQDVHVRRYRATGG
ncbi:MAG: hypothetical protein A2498_14170 [Lentisphaerae bacterium RIFOXYC12_FULL_60_16]|nr:MAG: hypothetical protein A2498_14170 [Lentisphaerae bacterium RIFOXYC12_FULL_60_16]OGV72972.1 MAG: hypothetical protein A2269_03370 [Lentisphaerae bacterium RIFOXYA12_FULL_60_10]